MGKKVLRIQLIDLYANILEDAFNCLWIEMPDKM
jgi:arginyl-tRNA synthetase